jgi:hypothetical protein
MIYPHPDWNPNDDLFADEASLKPNLVGAMRAVKSIYDKEQMASNIHHMIVLQNNNLRFKMTPESSVMWLIKQ